MSLETTARLRITCPDRPGIVAAVTGFLYSHGVNITALDQYSSDPEGGEFFMRLEFQTPYLDVSSQSLERSFEQVVAGPFQMQWEITYAKNLKSAAVFVSKYDHCLLEILWRSARGELPCEITMVVSNHPDLAGEVERFGVPFHHVPVAPGGKEEAEARMSELLQGAADLVILARYMQIFSGDFVQQFPSRIINIHHSFLPAFAGADPYRQAHEKGVKVIGATAHYVTAELDQGPIIEQDVMRVTHRMNVDDLRTAGRDLERQVLARALKWHLEDRIIVHGNKTIVF
jgi:formyltetrahydrofolate deformylase